jgi:hypothetical protein
MNLKELTKRIQELNEKVRLDTPTNIEVVGVRVDNNEEIKEVYFVTREELEEV